MIISFCCLFDWVLQKKKHTTECRYRKLSSNSSKYIVVINLVVVCGCSFGTFFCTVQYSFSLAIANLPCHSNFFIELKHFTLLMFSTFADCNQNNNNNNKWKRRWTTIFFVTILLFVSPLLCSGHFSIEIRRCSVHISVQCIDYSRISRSFSSFDNIAYGMFGLWLIYRYGFHYWIYWTTNRIS